MKRLLASLGVVGFLAGCNAGGISVQRIEPGAECAAGGVKITASGKEPELVCNGAKGTDGASGTNGTVGTNGSSGSNGATALIDQKTLASGDTRCPRGGVEITGGLDLGADGGTANDGVLQPGEVTSVAVVCTGDDHARVGSLASPPGAEGGFTIKANGGAGTTGNGGTGGTVGLELSNGSNGGHLKGWRTGRAAAAFPPRSVPAADLGSVPLSITTDTTLNFSFEPSSVPSGTPFVSNQGLSFLKARAWLRKKSPD